MVGKPCSELGWASELTKNVVRGDMYKNLIAFLGVFALGCPVTAQSVETQEMPQSCELVGSNGFVRLVVCSSTNTNNEVFASAGQAACRKDIPCGAWIWTDSNAVPDTAPSNHDGLTQDEVTSSKGVWVAEQETFIAIDTE